MLINIIVLFTGWLVLTSSLLTSLQLLQVVVTHLHVATVLLQTSGERSGVNLTRSALFLVCLLLGHLLGLNWSSRRAAEHRRDACTQSVTNGGSNSHSGGCGGHLTKQTWTLLSLGLGLWARDGRWVLGGWSGSGVSGSRLGSHWSGSSLSSHFLCVIFLFWCGRFGGGKQVLIYGFFLVAGGKCRMSPGKLRKGNNVAFSHVPRSLMAANGIGQDRSKLGEPGRKKKRKREKVKKKNEAVNAESKLMLAKSFRKCFFLLYSSSWRVYGRVSIGS